MRNAMGEGLLLAYFVENSATKRLFSEIFEAYPLGNLNAAHTLPSLQETIRVAQSMKITHRAISLSNFCIGRYQGGPLAFKSDYFRRYSPNYVAIAFLEAMAVGIPLPNRG